MRVGFGTVTRSINHITEYKGMEADEDFEAEYSICTFYQL